LALDTLPNNQAFSRAQGLYRHASGFTGTNMTFSVYAPNHVQGAKLPVVWFLSGLTCTHTNVTGKRAHCSACAGLGLIFLAPNTSPRGEDVPDDPAGSCDFGLGAGFYVDATEASYSTHYLMWGYVIKELRAEVAEHLPVILSRPSITGHFIGGHGALTMGLTYPDRFRSVSAFGPIAAPGQVPWGQKALVGYLGSDRRAWRQHDDVALIEDGAPLAELLVDQGDADQFMEKQLRPEPLEQACAAADIHLRLPIQPGYDHSYYFNWTPMHDHLRWRADRLR